MRDPDDYLKHYWKYRYPEEKSRPARRPLTYHPTELRFSRSVDNMDHSTWFSCTVKWKSDGGYVILSPNSSPLVEMEDGLETIERSRTEHEAPQEVIRGEEFCTFEVLGRCRFLVHGHDKGNSQTSGKWEPKDYARLQAELKGKTEEGSTIVNAAYVGFAMGMQGPVFMRKDTPRSPRGQGKRNTSARENRQASSSTIPNQDLHAEARHFNLKGVILKSEPATKITGQEVIPHYLMTTKINLVTAKMLVSGIAMETLITTAEEHDRFSKSAADLVENLKRGRAIHPFFAMDPNIINVPLPRGSDLSGLLQDSNRPAGNDNRRFSEITCNAHLLTRSSGYTTSTGFEYNVPYTEALEYPAELLRLLQDFARKYPKDLLPLPVMLLGCHLWVDVMKHPDMMLERYVLDKKLKGKAYQQVPEVSLTALIIYYPHWLRWTEWMGLCEHPHPFRFVHRAVESDYVNLGLSVVGDDLDQVKVMALMNKVTSRISSLDSAERTTVIPCAIPGSKMPPMYSPNRLRYITTLIPLALTGLVNVRYYGLPDYSIPENHCMDRPLMFHAQNPSAKDVTIYLPKFVNNSICTKKGTQLETTAPMVSKLFALPRDIFPYWKLNNARNIREPSPSAISVPPSKWTINPPGWAYRLDTYVPAHVLGSIAEFHRAHYQKMVKEGFVSVNGASEMYIGDNLMWTPRGMDPLTPEDLDNTPPRIIYGNEAIRRSPTPGVIRFSSASPSTGRSPEPETPVDSADYGPLLEALSKVPDGAHWSWKEGLQQLKDLPEGGRSEEILKKLVSQAIYGESQDITILNQRLTAMSELVPLTDEDIYVVIPTALGRLIGLEPPEAPVKDTWLDHFANISTETRDDEILCITDIMNHLKTAKKSPRFIPQLRPKIQASFNELKTLLAASPPGNWLDEKWTNYTLPRSTPERM